MNDRLRPGAHAGYVVLVLDRFTPNTWNETPSGIFGSIVTAVAMVGDYEARQQGAEQQDTFAVGKVSLSMISRPDA